MDAKDILGLPKSAFPGSQEKKSRPPKEPQRKPDGVSREVYALTGGVLPPLMPNLEPSHLKKRPTVGKEKITWQWLPFTSSARTDSLQLYHWVRVVNGVPPTGDYAFAKYNKSVDVLKYTDEEYEKHLTDNAWSKEETDQLFELCEKFDLRFIAIADRFPSDRTVEELKSRYYSVTRKLLIARAASPEDVANHPIVKEQFNAKHETERKRALSAVLSQTKLQERKDSEILAEAKRIMESRTPNKAADEVELQGHSEVGSGEKATGVGEDVSPVTASIDAPPVIPDTSSIPANLRMQKVYLRSNALDQMLQAVSTASGRTNIHIEQMIQDLSVNLKPKVPTKAVCAEHLELRKEILTLLNLQKQMQKLTEATGSRERPHSEAPATPKRSNRDVDRPFGSDAGGFGGERTGKRDQKRKAPGRFGEPPPSPPQSKRPRKYKASD
ncbi:SWR1-complex protein 4 [Rhynchospora pubera]|uniref:SWR1-complex protein 4 n=1 Tax=Rhynchospora pubera TaxID=906938 RepID=A0AAV8DV09_9POAL|nr:SWR1-complex protein 4 [Rhynchospora pubera]